MENLSNLLSALEEVYEDVGEMKVYVKAGRNQSGEATHRLRRAVVKEFNGVQAIVFEAVDECDLGGR